MTTIRSKLHEKLNEVAPPDPRWDFLMEVFRPFVSFVFGLFFVYGMYVLTLHGDATRLDNWLILIIRYCLLYGAIVWIILSVLMLLTLVIPYKPKEGVIECQSKN
jgi:hypothetical protein